MSLVREDYDRLESPAATLSGSLSGILRAVVIGV
jgi:hypothetical protein